MLEQHVVKAYSDNLDLLARHASAIRRGMVENCLWPRMMILLPEGHKGVPLSTLAPALGSLPLSPRQLYVNFRKGSLIEDITIFFVANPQAFAVIRRAIERVSDVASDVLRKLPQDRIVIKSLGFKFLVKGDLGGYQSVAVERYLDSGGDRAHLEGTVRERLSVVLSKDGPLIPAMKKRPIRRRPQRDRTGRQLRLPEK